MTNYLPFDEALYASWHPYFMSNSEVEEMDAATADENYYSDFQAELDHHDEEVDYDNYTYRLAGGWQ